MATWLTTQQLAELAGIHLTNAQKAARAALEDAKPWRGVTLTVRAVNGMRGGNSGTSYEARLDSLPNDLQMAWAMSQQTDAEAQAAAQLAMQADIAKHSAQDKAEAEAARQAQQLLTLSPKQAAQAKARIYLRFAIEEYMTTCLDGKTRCLEQFCADWNAGKIDSPHRAVITKLSPATARRLLTGEAGPLLKYGNRKGEGLMNDYPEVGAYLLRVLRGYAHATASQLHQAAVAEFNHRDDIQIPSYKTVQRWLSAWRKANPITDAINKNPDNARGKYLSAQGKMDEDVTRIFQRIELDGTKGDIMCADGRWTIITLIDVFTRWPLTLVAKSESSGATGALLRQWLLERGVGVASGAEPGTTIVTDNGSAFASDYIKHVLEEGLGIKVKYCKPGAPYEKPYVETFNRSQMHGIVPLLDGYTGHNVARADDLRKRQAAFKRLFKSEQSHVEVPMTGAELQEKLSLWNDKIYLHRAHSGLKGKTPYAAIQDAKKSGLYRPVTDIRALDILLSYAGTRTVQKKGIKLDSHPDMAGGWYIAPELAGDGIIGQVVHIYYDPHDFGTIYLYGQAEGDATPRYLCTAVDPDRTGHSRAEIAAHARGSAAKNNRRALQAMGNPERGVGDKILQHADQQASQVEFKPCVEAHVSAVLTELGNIQVDTDTGEIIEQTQIDAARERLAQQEQRAKLEDYENPAHKAQRLLIQVGVGKDLTPDEHAWLTDYRSQNPAAAARLEQLLAG